MPEVIPDLSLVPGWCCDAEVEVPGVLQPPDARNPDDWERLPFVTKGKERLMFWTSATVFVGYTSQEHGVLFAIALMQFMGEEHGGDELMTLIVRDIGAELARPASMKASLNVHARVAAFWETLTPVLRSGASGMSVRGWNRLAQQRIGSMRRCRSVCDSPVTGRTADGIAPFVGRAMQPQ